MEFILDYLINGIWNFRDSVLLYWDYGRFKNFINNKNLKICNIWSDMGYVYLEIIFFIKF